MTAIIVTIDAVRTRAGTQEAILSLAVPLEQGELIAAFMGKVGQQVGVAFAEVGGKPKPDEPSGGAKGVTSDSTDSEELTGGKLAQDLDRRGAWRNPKIWEALCKSQSAKDAYRKWVAMEHPCMICGSEGDDRHPHHWQEEGQGIMGGKVPDYQCVTLCHNHHSGPDGIHASSLESTDRIKWQERMYEHFKYKLGPVQTGIKNMAEFNRMKAKELMGIASMREITPELLAKLEEELGVKI